jgi:hypothetical protein
MESMGKGSLRRFGALIALAIALAGVIAATATAEAPTRDEYVARLEGICRPDSEATQGAMRGVRDDVSAGRTRIAGAKFANAARIFAGTVRKMKSVPRPVADLERLRKWFVYLGRQERYLGEVTTQLDAGKVIRAQRAIARFIHNGNLANNVVLAFGFNYCEFRFSRYGGR